jgi:hypothetical protein
MKDGRCSPTPLERALVGDGEEVEWRSGREGERDRGKRGRRGIEEEMR